MNVNLKATIDIKEITNDHRYDIIRITMDSLGRALSDTIWKEWMKCCKDAEGKGV